MIRINLLGQPRPRARRAPVPVGTALPVILLVATLVLAGGFIVWRWSQVQQEIDAQNSKIATLTAEKKRLEDVKREVEEYERQKPALEQRKAVIDELRRNRTGGQELLTAVATTVTRTEALWLTQMTRKGSSLTIEGTAGSINAVANFITELKRSGYFERIEIKESRQDERNQAVATYLFSLTADFVLPQSKLRPASVPGPGKS